MPDTEHAPPPHPGSERTPPQGKELGVYVLTALGIVYGDIGTSPLYALRDCFHGPHALGEVTPANVLGVLSLIVWSLLLVVSVKYLMLILRADNRGEGGILALMALAVESLKSANPIQRAVVVALGLFGAGLLYGDGIITPAVSVLGAWEGLQVAAPGLEDGWIVLLSVATLLVLFYFQRRGTAGVGRLFGPVMVFWFLTLGVLGLVQLVKRPEVLAAVSPHYAVAFFSEHGLAGVVILGTVFLVVTGGEALYADMGHFGRRPIRVAWFAVVLPGLLLNYFGQAALLLSDPQARENPFFHMVPSWGVWPLVVLATMAAVIASQALISGAFSITHQAIQMGFIPRMKVVHTSAREMGQIYVPTVNWLLLISVIATVLSFRSSGNLTAAYGIAVTATMVITTLLAYVVATRRWGWKPWLAVAVMLPLLAMDVAFLGANALKILDGGWFPLAGGVVMFTLMTTWKRGRAILARKLQAQSFPLEYFLASLDAQPPLRARNTAVFMTGSSQGTPPALMHNWKHNNVIHERVVLLTVIFEEVPHLPDSERMEIFPLAKGFVRIIVRYGFMESPSILQIMKLAAARGFEMKMMETSFFLGRETLIPTREPGMALWREALFAWMSRNALTATAFFQIPPNRVVELGAQVEL